MIKMANKIGELVKLGIILVVTIVALLTITNLGAGVIEFIPDNFPLLGNMDEAIAVLWLAGISRRFLKVDPSKVIAGVIK